MRRSLLLASCWFLSAAMQAVQGEGFDKALDTVLPRVVKLYGAGAGQEQGYGSGVLVSRDGLVLTVFSLLADARVIRAVTHDGTIYSAEVVHRDLERQLALLRLRPAKSPTEFVDVRAAEASPAQPEPDAIEVSPFPFFEISCGETSSSGAPCPTPRPGDWVVAAGNAFKVAEGEELVSIAHGVFSTRTRLDARIRLRDYPYRGDVLVIDAITSNPGAPGSAVVNLDGEFVGMVGREVISNLTHTHLNYAMPRDVLAQFLSEALAAQSGQPEETPPATTTPRPAVDPGIRIARTGYQSVLPFVDRVVRDSPAARAGVRKDDLILSINGRSVADIDEYDARMKSLEPGEPIDLVIRRGRQILTASIR